MSLFNNHINSIIEYMEAIELGQLDRPLLLLRQNRNGNGNDELDRIANTINSMRIRLLHEIEAQQLAE